MALKRNATEKERGKKVDLPEGTLGVQEPQVGSTGEVVSPNLDNLEQEGGRVQPLPAISAPVSVEDQLRVCADNIQGVYDRLSNAPNQTHVDAIRVDLLSELDKIRELSGLIFENI